MTLYHTVCKLTLSIVQSARAVCWCASVYSICVASFQLLGGQFERKTIVRPFARPISSFWAANLRIERDENRAHHECIARVQSGWAVYLSVRHIALQIFSYPTTWVARKSKYAHITVSSPIFTHLHKLVKIVQYIFLRELHLHVHKGLAAIV